MWGAQSDGCSHPGRSLRPCFTASARNAAIAGKATRSARATTNHCRISGVPTTSSTASLGLYGVFVAQTVALADILLMFLYTEAIGMIAVFYTGRGAPLESQYQAALILTDWQPCGRFLVALGQRRALVTMNHIDTSDAPCPEPPETVLMGQDQRSLV